MFLLRRFKFLPLYAISYILTRSGSGLLVLVATFAIYPLIAPLKSLRVIAIGSIVALTIGTAYLVAPEPFDPIVKRLDEFSSTKSSGYARYVAQLQTWDYLLQTDRVLIGSGPGGLERSPAYFGGSGNPALKLVADYGIIGLVIFLFYLLLSIFRKDNSMLALTMLVCYQLGGGNLAMAPFLIMMAMLCIWSQPPSARLRSVRRPASVRRTQSNLAQSNLGPVIE
jgi:O-antigen ligase